MGANDQFCSRQRFAGGSGFWVTVVIRICVNKYGIECFRNQRRALLFQRIHPISRIIVLEAFQSPGAQDGLPYCPGVSV